jgi:hypothetical protein
MKTVYTQNELQDGKLVELVDEGRPFRTSNNSFSGNAVRPGLHGTWLDKEWLDRLTEDRPKIVYTIYSYYTPIAWRLPSGWVIVSQHFSPTTTQHQHITKNLRPRVHGGFALLGVPVR